MAKSERFEMRVSAETLERIDVVRGGLSRAAWIGEAIEERLLVRPVSPADMERAVRDGKKLVAGVREVQMPSRASRPERHEFSSGEEWQAAVRVWKEQW